MAEKSLWSDGKVAPWFPQYIIDPSLMIGYDAAPWLYNNSMVGYQIPLEEKNHLPQKLVDIL